MKECSQCKEYHDNTGSYCKSCRSVYNKSHRLNIAIDVVKTLMLTDACEVCGETRDQMSRSLCIDHNHKTGEVRGILCSHCNTALGLLKEDEGIMNNLIKYVNR